jgi:hypothetical protein
MLIFNLLQLDNFIQIVGISCSTDSMDLNFDSQHNANAAFKEWATHIDLTVLVGHERKCDGEQEGTFILSNIQLTGSRISAKILKIMQRRDVVTDWQLSVKQRDINLEGLEKRGYLSRINHDINSRFNPEINYTNSNNYSFFTNYNKTKQSSNVKRLTLVEFFQYSAYCINCYTNGTAESSLEFEGRLSHIKSYSMKLKGELHSNIDLKLIKGYWGEKKVWSKKLMTVPVFIGISIPGVASLIPEFRIKISVKQEGRAAFTAFVGVDFTLPLDIHINGNDSFLAPTMIQHGTPRVNPHPMQDLVVGMKGNIGILLLIHSFEIRR